MLPVMTKLSAILESECIITLEFLLLSKESERGQRFCHKRTSFILQSFIFFDDFSVLASNNNYFKVTLMESLLINSDNTLLNKNRHSLPLELFDDLGT